MIPRLKPKGMPACAIYAMGAGQNVGWARFGMECARKTSNPALRKHWVRFARDAMRDARRMRQLACESAPKRQAVTP